MPLLNRGASGELGEDLAAADAGHSEQLAQNDENDSSRRVSLSNMRNFASLDVERSLASGSQQSGDSTASLVSAVRRGSKSMELMNLQASDSGDNPEITAALSERNVGPSICQGTVLEVPVDLLHPANIDVKSGLNEMMPKSGAVSTPVSSMGQCGSLRCAPSKRKWPSFRARLGRIGSTVVRSHHSLCSNFSPNNNSGETALVNSLNLETDTCTKRDAKVQFDDNANSHENTFPVDPFMEEIMKTSRSSKLKEQFFAFFQPSDNRLAMKLFGNKNALMKEKERQQQHGRFVIHPCSNFRWAGHIPHLQADVHSSGTVRSNA